MAVDPKTVAKLRADTGAGMMDCKKALLEVDGDLEKAKDLLRKRGLEVAAKKSGRSTNNGWIGSYTCEELVGYGYDCTACYDEGLCPVFGCTDSGADNYDVNANTDDGTCTYPCAGLVVDMVDSYGDGWNGNVLTVGDQSFTIETGSVAQGCYTGATEDVAVTCDGGSYQSEVSWTISDADGNELLSGGAPYVGCLGSCTCDDETACNTGAEGDCAYPDTGLNCDGSVADGYFMDCVGTIAPDSYLSWQGDGYCDDGAYGIDFECCDFNMDDSDCDAALDCDGVASDCGGAVVDDCLAVNYDFNQDGVLNIIDVIEIVNILIGNEAWIDKTVLY